MIRKCSNGISIAVLFALLIKGLEHLQWQSLKIPFETVCLTRDIIFADFQVFPIMKVVSNYLHWPACSFEDSKPQFVPPKIANQPVSCWHHFLSPLWWTNMLLPSLLSTMIILFQQSRSAPFALVGFILQSWKILSSARLLFQLPKTPSSKHPKKANNFKISCLWHTASWSRTNSKRTSETTMRLQNLWKHPCWFCFLIKSNLASPCQLISRKFVPQKCNLWNQKHHPNVVSPESRRLLSSLQDSIWADVFLLQKF